MEIIPAIDIQNSRVVRLIKGKFESNKIYSKSPVEIAKKWERLGATYLHLIDLDGAKRGRLENRHCIRRILDSTNLKVQVGGGIRSREIAEELLALGVERLILGTVVREKNKIFKQLLNLYKEKITVSVDTKNSTVMLKGWKQASELDYLSYVEKLESVGVKRIIYTDILKDGTLSSPNFSAIEELLNSTNISVIASGGITNLEDIEKLYDLSPKGLEGIIIGKALYEGKISLQQCINRFSN